jgi:hypothetical protein
VPTNDAALKTGDAFMASASDGMLEPTPQPELLSTLGRLARGLSVLFWGLPIALVVCVQSAKGDWFRPLGVIPPLVATGLLLYGLVLLGGFQKQERVWRSALERAQLFALINVGMSPFLYWWNRIPANPFFGAIIEALTLSGLLFLILLNPMLVRLTAMLPDETLRMETRLFTLLNRYILSILLALSAAYYVTAHIDPDAPGRLIRWILMTAPLPHQANMIFYFFDRAGQWIILFLLLLPVAMTMAQLRKIQEDILSSVFGPEH